ncbi:MAG TPA: alpha/beta fold hydrolase [Gemmatimonadaceae bacterium]|nr:alpha/beta fold hydrolase [Gemmatimonadaceae bacterium]
MPTTAEPVVARRISGPPARPTRKRLAVFVHGFNSSPAVWNPLLALLRQDQDVASVFDFECFEYSTGILRVPIIRRFPNVLEIGRGLSEWLQSIGSRYRDVTLVGHSQGGLVIQSFLLDRLDDDRGESLERVRQVLLLATPNLGSTALTGVRKLFSLLLPNSQEYMLRVLNSDIAKLMREVQKRIVGAGDANAREWPVAIQALWGEMDQIVPEASARGAFTSGFPIPGDHSSILKPTSGMSDRRYRAVRDALLRPIGHRNVFDVGLYEVSIAPHPVPPPGTFELSKLGTPRTIQTDNIARVDQSVTFTERNRCDDLFTLSYGTLNQNGWVDATPSHDNEAPAQSLSDYQLSGLRYPFCFKPKPLETPAPRYTLSADVYDGFGTGNRNWHFHMRKPNERRHYWRFQITIDLRAYLEAKYSVTVEPTVSLYREDVEHGDLCRRRDRRLAEQLAPVDVNPDGVWTFEVDDMSEGVVDASWDVAPNGP